MVESGSRQPPHRQGGRRPTNLRVRRLHFPDSTRLSGDVRLDLPWAILSIWRQCAARLRARPSRRHHRPKTTTMGRNAAGLSPAGRTSPVLYMAHHGRTKSILRKGVRGVNPRSIDKEYSTYLAVSSPMQRARRRARGVVRLRPLLEGTRRPGVGGPPLERVSSRARRHGGVGPSRPG